MTISRTGPVTAQLSSTLTRADATRFLQRATFGPSPEDVDRLVDIGIEAWLDDQLATAPVGSHLGRRIEHGGTVPSIWESYLSAPDQLRKRFAYALSQIFVISGNVVGNERVASYADLLEAHCFGSYRNLLEQVTRSQAMGQYLTYENNQRADPARGTVPDENYAREILQLFSIGLWERNLNGRLRRDAQGNPIPTYDNDDIVGLARVFTGFSMPYGPLSVFAEPMVSTGGFATEWHEKGEKRFLGQVIPANPNQTLDQSVTAALDIITGHRNVGPFICQQLIQRLVTANPTPGYVRRVARVFNNDGSGNRGNLAAVLRAILLDAEAWRSPQWGRFGKVREPVLRFTTITRSLRIAATGTPWPIFSLADRANALGQQPYEAPSVFNFYRPGYTPPNTRLGERGFVAPELQITDETTTIGWINFLQQFLMDPPQAGPVRIELQLDDLIALTPDLTVTAAQAEALVTEVTGRLCPDGLQPIQRRRIVAAIQGASNPNIAPGDTYNRDRLLRGRVVGAIVMVAATTDFIHEK